jgi:hypothetical protein
MAIRTWHILREDGTAVDITTKMQLSDAISAMANDEHKRIGLTECMCEQVVFDLDEFIKAQTTDVYGNHIMPEDGGMTDEEIDRLRNLAIDEAMPLGDPEAGLTVVRLPNS